MGSCRKLALLSRETVRFFESSGLPKCLHASLEGLMVRVAKLVFVTTSFLVYETPFLPRVTRNLYVFTGKHFRGILRVANYKGRSIFFEDI